MALRLPSIGYGLKPDERQTAAFHRAGYRALGPVLVALFIGTLYGHFTANDALSMWMAVIFLIGINIFGYHVERSGWEDHKRDEIARHPYLRRRALRSIVLSGLLGGILTAAQDYYPEQERLGSALISGAIFAVFLMGLFWWMDVRKARREE
jgi:hypothetical protein